MYTYSLNVRQGIMKHLMILMTFMVSGCSILDRLAVPAGTLSMVGDIDEISAEGVCERAEYGATYVLNSNGGSLPSAYKIIGCIKDLDLTLAVRGAASAATYLLFTASKVCLYPDALVEFHQPATMFSWYSGIVLPKARLDKYQAQTAAVLRNANTPEEVIDTIYEWEGKAPNHIDAKDLAVMPHELVIDLLGDRFIGYCYPQTKTGDMSNEK